MRHVHTFLAFLLTARLADATFGHLSNAYPMESALYVFDATSA